MLRTLLDWIWPTLEGAGTSPAPTLPSVQLSEDVSREMCARLEAAVEADVDRMKAIDAKLMAVCAVAPICVTLLLAIAGFITTQGPLPICCESMATARRRSSSAAERGPRWTRGRSPKT